MSNTSSAKNLSSSHAVKSSAHPGPTSLPQVREWCAAHPSHFQDIIAEHATPAAIREWHRRRPETPPPLLPPAPAPHSDLERYLAGRVLASPAVQQHVERMVDQPESMVVAVGPTPGPFSPTLDDPKALAACVQTLFRYDYTFAQALSVAEGVVRALCPLTTCRILAVGPDGDTVVMSALTSAAAATTIIDAATEAPAEQSAALAVFDLAQTEHAAALTTTNVQHHRRSSAPDETLIFPADLGPIPVDGTLLVFPLRPDDRPQTLGLLQVLTPGDGTHLAAHLAVYVSLLAPFLWRAQLFDETLAQCRLSKVLLGLTEDLFERLDDKNAFLSKVVVHAAALLQCERCSVFVVDHDAKELYATVFDKKPSDIVRLTKGAAKAPAGSVADPCIRFKMNKGIAGYVATTGKTLAIADAYQDERFNKEIDIKTGFHTKTILCMPLFNAGKKVVGVVQMINKRHGVFTARDEALFASFGVYCGLGLQAAQLHEELKHSEHRHRVALNVLSYHACATDEDVERAAQMEIPSAAVIGVNELDFDSEDMSADGMFAGVVRMFMDSGFAQDFGVPHPTLCRWILSVRKNYRDVTYHNWAHAFNVTQCMFFMLQQCKLARFLTHLERHAMLIACLCHDLDHRGTNNAFEGLVQSDLSKLYSTSTMERHHLDMCIMILNSDGNSVLSGLAPADYETTMSILKKSILATDISTYLKNRNSYTTLVKSNEFLWENEAHRDLFRAMLMTGADLSAIARPWEVQKKVAMHVYREFFEQGDMEVSIAGKTTQDMFNRTQASRLPKMQLGFIDFICLPVYDALTAHIPEFQPLAVEVRTNRQKWELLSTTEYSMPDDIDPLTGHGHGPAPDPVDGPPARAAASGGATPAATNTQYRPLSTGSADLANGRDQHPRMFSSVCTIL